MCVLCCLVLLLLGTSLESLPGRSAQTVAVLLLFSMQIGSRTSELRHWLEERGYTYEAQAVIAQAVAS